MNVVFTNMTLQNRHFHLGTNLTNQIPNTSSNRTGQKGLAVFGNPYKMQLDVKTSMKSTTIMIHRIYGKHKIA
jgi:hypothetical protein